MKKIGLVLAGGGGKGAYQIGVWKALKDLRIDRSIGGVSGTSVGALNGALFLHGSYNLAEDIWLNISYDKFLSANLKTLLKAFLKMGINNLFPNPAALMVFIMKLSRDGIFSREGIKEILNENINLRLISTSDITLYATCCEILTLKPEYFKLNNSSEERILSILLASSAIPGIYGSIEIEGKKYIDGGVRDNIPIKPIYDEGYRDIIVVNLDSRTNINYSKFPGVNIIEIAPERNLGNFITGILDFRKEGAKARIEQGYNDGKRILEPIFKKFKNQSAQR